MRGLLVALLLPALLDARLATSASLYENGTDCASQHTLQPFRARHGFPQKSEAPIKFTVLDSNFRPTQVYRPGNVYTVELMSSIALRGFVLQPRLSTRQGFIIGHLRGGYFVQDASWDSYAIKMQDCVTNFNNSLTHRDWEQKFLIRASWTADRVVGPVQFFMTVFHMKSVFWERIQPLSGFLLPDPTYVAPPRTARQRSVLAAQAPPPVHELLHQPSEPFIEEKPVAVKSVDISPLVAEARKLSLLVKDIVAKEPQPEPEAGAEPEPEPELASAKLSELPSLLELPKQAEASSRSLLRFAPIGLKETRKLGELPTLPEPAPEPPAQFELEDLVEAEPLAEPEASGEPAAEPEPVVVEAVATAKEPEALVYGDNILDLAASVLSLSPGQLNFEAFDPELAKKVALKFAAEKEKEIVIDPETDYCDPQPCYSGGTCANVKRAIEGYPYKCLCPKGWRGPRCERRDYCAENPCEMGMCTNDDRHHTYKCQCFDNFVGSKCQRACNPGFCGFGGTCSLDEGSGALRCDCAAGRTGDRCETEIDECAASPCLNGAHCTDQLAGFHCSCEQGFMGKKCHRPCQDIYPTCGNWSTGARCGRFYDDAATGHEFFKLNCAASCGFCKVDERTVVSQPLPPSLEALEWLVGDWFVESRTEVLFPYDLRGPYNQTLRFSVTQEPLMGVPSLEFRSDAVGESGDTDKARGFLTIDKSRKGLRPLASLLTFTSDGSLIMEEAKVERWRLVFTALLKRPSPPNRQRRFPTEVSREFELAGSYLRETISKRYADGERSFATKYFYKRADEFPV